ncbi:MAG: ABC transporter substrate-binding protein [Woeseiaceae bacterium]|nr:ABC transporter substrate-binding protein [Woeseiaceae bacterium]
MEAAGRALGRELVVVNVSTEHDIEPAFAKFVQAKVGALLVSGSPLIGAKRKAIIALAARHAIPAIYDRRGFVADGGLMSYGTSFKGAYRQAGTYAGKILKGAKTSELPILQPTHFTLAINSKTAKALGLDVPRAIYFRADEVIE